MITGGIAVPELLDTVLGGLSRRDLYTCLFVSEQFHDHATPLLYRSLSFYLHPERYPNQFSSQQLLWERILRFPHLLRYVRQISVFLNPVHLPAGYKGITDPPFGDRISHILRHVELLEF